MTRKRSASLSILLVRSDNMPFMNIYLLEDSLWHTDKPGKRETDCGKQITSAARKERIGGQSASIRQPPKEDLCRTCFKFVFKS